MQVAVPAGVLVEVLLVVVLYVVEPPERLDLGGDRPVAGGVQRTRVGLAAGRVERCLLRRGGVEQAFDSPIPQKQPIPNTAVCRFSGKGSSSRVPRTV
jgi:hypothetical protein